MRSLKRQISVLFLGALVVVLATLITVFGWYMKNRDEAAAKIKVQTDLATCKEIINARYPGWWSVKDGELYKGTEKISSNNVIVDQLAQLTGDTVTIFLSDTKTAATDRRLNGEHAININASRDVSQRVLSNGQTYIGEDVVLGQPYQTAFAPLRAENGAILGMVFVGFSQAAAQRLLARSLIIMAAAGLAIIVLAELLVCFFLRKIIVDPSQTVLLETQEEVENLQKVNVSGTAKIEKLEGAFIQMAEHIQTLTEEISRSAGGNTESPSEKSGVNAIIEQLKGSEPLPELSDDNAATGNIEPLSGMDTPWRRGAEELPKGLNKATLDQIFQFLQTHRRPVSTEEVAEGVKLTRVTVRRYLEFLEQSGVLKSEQKCGTVGRPVKIFIPM